MTARAKPCSGVAPAPIPERLVEADPTVLPIHEVDVVVVGSGIAGLSTAVMLAPHRSVAVVSKAPLPSRSDLARSSAQEGATPWAQGGMAAAIGPDDHPSLHAADTRTAGAGLCDVSAVGVLTEGAAEAVSFLVGCGVGFDLGGVEGDGTVARAPSGGRAGGPAERSGGGALGDLGRFHLTLEGGHRRRRVLHAGGDATGAGIWRALATTTVANGVSWHQGFLLDLLTDPDGTVRGVLLAERGALRLLLSSAVVLATGGAGRLFASTTAPGSCTGDGMAAALRAGAELSDLEMVQFHPTALFSADDPRRLVSEAVRGEGAVLVDADGTAVMAGQHPLGDLAPRDVVSRVLHRRMSQLGQPHLYLDATSLGTETLATRFPTLVHNCRRLGIDPARTPVPVSPAAHYTIGGIRTDLAGATTLRNLFAVGEAASTGVHGANRLASNSLLEGVVFGRRAAQAIIRSPRAVGSPVAGRHLVVGRHSGATGRLRQAAPRPVVPEATDAWLRPAMTRHCGVVRSGAGLEELQRGIQARLGIPSDGTGPGAWETANLYQLAWVMAGAAARREESRGAHHRSDHPEVRPSPAVHQRVAVVCDPGIGLDPDGPSSRDSLLCWRFDSDGVADVADRTADGTTDRTPDRKTVASALSGSSPETVPLGRSG